LRTYIRPLHGAFVLLAIMDILRMFETESGKITSVPYDVEKAAKRIRQNGLPYWLVDRLLIGR
jgi:hypothetical protein